MNIWMQFNWIKVVAIIMLIGVIPAMNYDFPRFYFELLNWVVMGAGLILAMQASERNRMLMMWFAIFIAVLFNPFALFSIRVDIWQIIDIFVAIFFFASMVLIRPVKLVK